MLRREAAKDNGKATAKNGCSVGCGVVVGLRAPGSFAGEGLGVVTNGPPVFLGLKALLTLSFS